MRESYKEAGWGKIKHEDDQVCCGVIAKQIMRDTGIDVRNVSLDPNYQAIDVDLIGTDSNGNQTFYEIKADDYYASNGKKIFLETISNTNKGTDGCVLASQANMFIWVFLKYNCFAVIDANQLKWYVSNNKNTWTDAKRTGTYNDEQLYYQTEGYVRSLADLSQAGVWYSLGFLDADLCAELEAQQTRKKEAERKYNEQRNNNNQPPPPEPPREMTTEEILKDCPFF